MAKDNTADPDAEAISYDKILELVPEARGFSTMNFDPPEALVDDPDFDGRAEAAASAVRTVVNLIAVTPMGYKHRWGPLLKHLHLITRNWSAHGYHFECFPVGELDHVLLNKNMGNPMPITSDFHSGKWPCRETVAKAVETALETDPAKVDFDENDEETWAALAHFTIADWAPPGVERISRWKLALLWLEHTVAKEGNP